MIDKLANEKLRAIALAKLEGLTDEEVAERFTRSRKWVQRQKELIRKELREAVDGNVPS